MWQIILHAQEDWACSCMSQGKVDGVLGYKRVASVSQP